MKTELLILLLCLLCCVQLFPQIVPGKQIDNHKENAIYIEVLGNSVTGLSLNYDRIIKHYTNSFINVTAGIGIGDYSSFNFPFSANYSFSISPPNHYIELGLGTGIHFFDDIKERNTRILITSRLGYKYQRPRGGFYLRAGFTPVAPLFYFKDNDYHETLFTSKTKSYGEWELLENFDLFFCSVSLCLGYSF